MESAYSCADYSDYSDYSYDDDYFDYFDYSDYFCVNDYHLQNYYFFYSFVFYNFYYDYCYCFSLINRSISLHLVLIESPLKKIVQKMQTDSKFSVPKSWVSLLAGLLAAIIIIIIFNLFVYLCVSSGEKAGLLSGDVIVRYSFI